MAHPRFRTELRTATDDDLRAAQRATGLRYRPAQEELLEQADVLTTTLGTSTAEGGPPWSEEQWHRWATHPDERVLHGMLQNTATWEHAPVGATHALDRVFREAAERGEVWNPVIDRVAEREWLVRPYNGPHADAMIAARQSVLRHLAQVRTWAARQPSGAAMKPFAEFESSELIACLRRSARVIDRDTIEHLLLGGKGAEMLGQARCYWLLRETRVHRIPEAIAEHRAVQESALDALLDTARATFARDRKGEPVLTLLRDLERNGHVLPQAGLDGLIDEMGAASTIQRWQTRTWLSFGLAAFASLSQAQLDRMWELHYWAGAQVKNQQGTVFHRALVRSPAAGDALFDRALKEFPSSPEMRTALAGNERAAKLPQVRALLRGSSIPEVLMHLCKDAEPREFRSLYRRLAKRDVRAAAHVLENARDEHLMTLKGADLQPLLLAPSGEVRLAGIRATGRLSALSTPHAPEVRPSARPARPRGRR
jgi:hypothetical protein